MKKVLSLVLVLSMVLGSFSFAFAAPNDVVGTEYEDAVERLGQLKVLEGYPDGTFKPGNEITRAEFAAVVIRAKGLAAAADAAKGATGFTDVPATNWAAGYINIASKMGFVKGMGDGTFAPNSPVTYEQAVTMVMRALGYEPAAEARGGYPYGYLIVANETGLLEKVNGTQGAPALRGLVAQIVDNALEIPLMVQVSYGDRVEHIVSGTRDGVAEKTLLSELNFTKFTGRVIEINEGKGFVKIENNDGVIKVLDVDEDFDFQNALGLRFRVWYDVYGDIQLYTALDTPMFDAVEYDSGYLYLYGEDDYYDLATNTKKDVIATLLLDGKKVAAKDFDADYAKVVLDTYGDIIWAEGFTLEGNVVVEKLDGNVVESFGYEELSLKGYTIVDRDGKTISVEDLKANDIVFYNSKVKFAVVYNESVTGAIEKVYQNPDSFMLDGEKYDVLYTKYLDGEALGDLDYNVVNSIKTEDEEVTAYFDFKGNLVLLEGTRAAAAAPNVVVVVDARKYADTRSGKSLYTLDVLNAAGKIVKYDLTAKQVADILKKDLDSNGNLASADEATWFTRLGVTASHPTYTPSDRVVQLSINSSDKVVGVTALTALSIVEDASASPATPALATTASYVDGKAKLQDSTVVFRVDDETDPADYAVTTWDKADEEFTKVTLGTAYANASNKVVAIYATKTNAKAATTVYTGLVTDLRVLRGNLKADVTMEIKGEEKVITVPTSIATYNKLVEDAIVKVTVVNKTGEISVVDNITTVTGKVVSTTPGSRIIKVGSTNYYLENDAVIYQDGSFATLRFADLKVNDIVELYPIATGSQYVNYVVKDVVEDDKPATGTITYIDVPVKAGADVVAKVTLPADNTTVYKVIAFDATGAAKNTVSTLVSKDVTATELGIVTPGEVNATYVVRTYKVVDGNDVEISSKVVKNVDVKAPVMNSATLTQANVVGATATYDVTSGGKTIKVDAAKAGVAGNGYKLVLEDNTAAQELNVSVDTAAKTITVKLEVIEDPANSGSYIVKSTLKDVVDAVNADTIANQLVKLSVAAADEATVATAVSAGAGTAGGADAKDAKITLVFDEDMKADTTATIKIGANEYNATVAWTNTTTAVLTIKDAEVVLGTDAADIKANVKALSLTDLAGNAVDFQ